jgi:oxygen-dependent protoporphyrinogen oxidase
MRIAIIGGGTAGLAAAYELEKARREGAPVEYELFEARERLGGALRSETVGGAVLEQGPDSFLTEKPATAELCRELGLGGDLIASNDAKRKTHIVVKNKLTPLPDGLMFLVPTKLIPTALSPLFSLKTKLLMAAEFLFPPGPSGKSDESVGDLVRRHYGQETVDRLADPLLSGVYGGDSTQLSARTVLARMVELEEQFGSLTRGMLSAYRQMKAWRKQHPPKPGAAARGIFTAIRGGMQELVNALTERIDPNCVRLNCPVQALERSGTGWNVKIEGGTKYFEAAIVCAPAWAAAGLLQNVDGELAAALEEIPYSSSVTVNLVYDEKALGKLPEGFGFLVPAVERRGLLACTFVHRKFLGRTPEGKVVFRAFLGGARNEAQLNESNEDLLKIVRRDLSEILGSDVLPESVEPEHVQITRWPRAMAQYAVGHLDRKRKIFERLATLEGLRLAGNAYDGIGVSDCIRLGREAARELVSGAK